MVKNKCIRIQSKLKWNALGFFVVFGHAAEVRAVEKVVPVATNQTPAVNSPVIITETALPYRRFDKVEITGSSIIRKDQTQTLPVQVVTRSEIQKSGKQNIADYLQSLPLMFNYFTPAQLGLVKGGFSGGAIHGLQQGTLVLINGRRLAGNGRQSTAGVDNGGVDLTWLPLSAIDRVEILTDGASSVYGTDAQSGVINIITRSEWPGVEITVDRRMPDDQKGVGNRVDLSVGKGRLIQDGYSWFIAADLHEQAQLFGRDRPQASAGRYYFEQDGKAYWAYGNSLTAARTGVSLATSKSAPWTRLWTPDYQNGQCPEGKVPASGQAACLDNTYYDKGLYPSQKSAKLHGHGQFQLSSDWVGYAELSWKKEEQERDYNTWPQYSAKIGTNPSAPGYDLAVNNGFDPAKGVWLLYNGSDLGETRRLYSWQTRRAVLGVKGQWQDWDVNAGYYYSDSYSAFVNQVVSAYPNLGVNSSGVLTNVALLEPLSSDSSAALSLRQQLEGMLSLKTSNEGTNKWQGVDLKASRTIGEVDGRDVLFAWGTDWRREEAKFDQFSTGSPSYRGQRAVWAQFAEIQLPLPNEVEMLASLRNDHYSDFGNTTHAKLGGKWAPSEQWLVRGAWSTGFRAPAVAQMIETDEFLNSKATSPCSTGLLAVATSLGGVCRPGNSYDIYTRGSSTLKPELSTQWNLGLRFSPDRNNTWSIDYWRIDLRDRISSVNSDIIFADPANHLENLRLNAAKELEIFAPMVNVGRTQSRGIDFGWSMRRPTDWGQMHLGVSGTRLLKSQYKLADDQPFVSDLNTYSYNYNVVVPKIKARMHVGLQQANWQGQIMLNYVGSHDDAGVRAISTDTGQAVPLLYHRVPAWVTLDIVAMYQVTPKTRLRLGIENVLNRDAPLDFGLLTTANHGTNPLLANVWGRTVYLSLTHQF